MKNAVEMNRLLWRLVLLCHIQESSRKGNAKERVPFLGFQRPYNPKFLLRWQPWCRLRNVLHFIKNGSYLWGWIAWKQNCQIFIRSVQLCFNLFSKSRTKNYSHRDFKNYSNNKFSFLLYAYSDNGDNLNVTSLASFFENFRKVLDKAAPKKQKFIRANMALSWMRQSEKDQIREQLSQKWWPTFCR